MKKITLFLCFLLVFGFLSAQEKQANYARVKVHASTQEHLITLLQKGVCLENISIMKGAFIIGEFSDREMEKITETQIPFEILIENMSEHYVKQNEGYSIEKLNEEMRKNPKTFNGNRTPENFKLGSMGGYLTLSEIMEELDEMKEKFPNLISERAAFPEQSFEGRDIYWVRISNNPDVEQEKPRVFYNALIHAREPASMHQMIYQMWDLLENYGKDPEITYYIDNLELYFVPCINPDGYEYNRQTNPNGGGMWRKNRSLYDISGYYGVDLNRNWGYMWGYDDIGSSPNSWDETYRGTGPFSEPEMQAIKNFCEDKNFLLCLNHHTCGDYLIYPWGYINEVPQEGPIYKAYAERLTSDNNYTYGTVYQVLGYYTNGGAEDWFYGEQETKNLVFSFCPETGNQADGFWPPVHRIEELCAGLVTMNKYMMRFALPFAEIEDKTEICFSSLNNTFAFDLVPLGQAQNINFQVTIEPVSNNIQSVQTTPLLFENMNILDREQGELSVVLKPTITSGEQVVFDVCVNTGDFTHKQRIAKIFGVLEKLIDDDCETMDNWICNNSYSPWGITTTKYVSPTHSITASPYLAHHTYDSRIYSKNSYNLKDALAVFAEFDAQWAINSYWSGGSAQFAVSENNGATWIPQHGKYTKLLYGEPVYNGSKSTWVRETIDLSAYKGKNIRVGFYINADIYYNFDGFYFDDFVLSVVKPTPISVPEFPDISNFTAYYNASTKKIVISNVENSTSFSLLSIEGKLINSFNVDNQHYEINVEKLPAGVYFLKTNIGKAQKIVIY